MTPRVIALKTKHWRALARDGSGQYPRRSSARWVSSTAFPQANGGVWAVRGDVVKRMAQREKAEVTRVSEARRALGVPVTLAVHALSCACTSGTSGRRAFQRVRSASAHYHVSYDSHLTHHICFFPTIHPTPITIQFFIYSSIRLAAGGHIRCTGGLWRDYWFSLAEGRTAAAIEWGCDPATTQVDAPSFPTLDLDRSALGRRLVERAIHPVSGYDGPASQRRPPDRLREAVVPPWSLARHPPPDCLLIISISWIYKGTWPRGTQVNNKASRVLAMTL
ncbi:uncharacterized protein LOC124697681 [Lolium rigidum]|uniref:uncharacterized protein LOC124697681 n=1 Tax=Lolium rigidum TaxID=89674 RepID=UPI001F5D6ED1|nr:uncharacterized protein LOC124697681 [Lolium rigidum]